MPKQDTPSDWQGQRLYIGIDVHKQSWTISIRSSGISLQTLTIAGANAKKLREYLQKHYKGGRYCSVYEAGFTGFSTHVALESEGIENIVVHPVDVPSTGKAKEQKSDTVDSKKLAIALESGLLKALYIPTQSEQEYRSLVRLRQKLKKDEVRVKNRIKGLLHYYGFSEKFQIDSKQYWSRKSIEELEHQEYLRGCAKRALEFLIRDLLHIRQLLAEVLFALRQAAKAEDVTVRAEELSLLQSVSGIGPLTAMVLQAELMNMARFSNENRLFSFVGFIPSSHSSGQHIAHGRMTHRANKYVRHVLIEAARVAIRQDPALLQAYTLLCRRMAANKAIIRIAKKLLRRIRWVWQHRQPYQISMP